MLHVYSITSGAAPVSEDFKNSPPISIVDSGNRFLSKTQTARHCSSFTVTAGLCRYAAQCDTNRSCSELNTAGLIAASSSPVTGVEPSVSRLTVSSIPSPEQTRAVPATSEVSR